MAEVVSSGNLSGITPVGRTMHGTEVKTKEEGDVAFRRAHSFSDLDMEASSQHHTLGFGNTQAAPGGWTKAQVDKLLQANTELMAEVAKANRVKETSASSSVTMQPNWTLTTINLRRLGNIVSIYLRVSRTGSAIPVVATGNIANTPILQVAPEWVANHTCTLVNEAQGKLSSGYINTSGMVSITATVSGYGITVGEEISLSGLYISTRDL